MCIRDRIWVIEVFCKEGISCCERKLRQYRCSDVSGEGPEGNRSGCKAVTGAAMTAPSLCADQQPRGVNADAADGFGPKEIP